MFRRKLIVILLLAAFICTLSFVSAENSTDVISAEQSDEIAVDEIASAQNDILANESETPSNSTLEPTQAPVEKSPAKIKASKITVAQKKSTKWNIKLTDSAGKALSGKKLVLKIFTGSKYKTVKLTTNSKGIASYNTKSLQAGTHKVRIALDDGSFKANEISSSIKVIKQTAIRIYAPVDNAKEGSLVTILVMNKKTKKFINGVKLKLKIYTGKKYKTVILKTKKAHGGNGVCAYATNQLSVGKHKVVITPVLLKYNGSKKVTMKIKKSAKKVPGWTIKV